MATTVATDGDRCSLIVCPVSAIPAARNRDAIPLRFPLKEGGNRGIGPFCVILESLESLEPHRVTPESRAGICDSRNRVFPGIAESLQYQYSRI